MSAAERPDQDGDGRTALGGKLGFPEQSAKVPSRLDQLAQALHAVHGSVSAIVKGGRGDPSVVLPALLSLPISLLTQQCYSPLSLALLVLAYRYCSGLRSFTTVWLGHHSVALSPLLSSVEDLLPHWVFWAAFYQHCL